MTLSTPKTSRASACAANHTVALPAPPATMREDGRSELCLSRDRKCRSLNQFFIEEACRRSRHLLRAAPKGASLGERDRCRLARFRPACRTRFGRSPGRIYDEKLVQHVGLHHVHDELVG